MATFIHLEVITALVEYNLISGLEQAKYRLIQTTCSKKLDKLIGVTWNFKYTFVKAGLIVKIR